MITPTLFNFTLNPDAGLRIDMRALFERVARAHTYPIRLNGRDIVDFLQIDTVLACLPGGRGCVGKERLGRTLHDRQVAMVDSSGVKYNPARPDAVYGFLHLVGFVQYKDGKQNKIVIPVEPSGVIGLRAGSSSLSAFNPNENRTQNRLLRSIDELEGILFGFLGIPKRTEPKMAMLNAYFNAFTDKTGKDRPRIVNFVRFLRDFYNSSPELQAVYNKGTTPWLGVQGGPTVMKSSFKPKFEDGANLHKNFKKNVDTPPTFTLSPYGHVELMGARSFVGIKRAYNIIVRATRVMNERGLVTFQAPNDHNNPPQPARTRPRKALDLSQYFPITFTKKGRTLMINKKPCEKYPKSFVTHLAEINGIPSRGKISTVCARLHDLPQLVQMDGSPRNNDAVISTKVNRKGETQTMIRGRQCKTMPKAEVIRYAIEYGIDPKLPVKEICKRLAHAVVPRNNNDNHKSPTPAEPPRKNNDNHNSPTFVYHARSPEQPTYSLPPQNNNHTTPLPSNAMTRFMQSKKTIHFLKRYHPEKNLKTLQQIAAHVWTRDMNDAQRRKWIRTHAHDSPVRSVSKNDSPTSSSNKKSASSNGSSSVSSTFLHSLYNQNESPASVRTASSNRTSTQSKTSASSNGSSSVSTPSSTFLHSLYNQNESPASVRTASNKTSASSNRTSTQSKTSASSNRTSTQSKTSASSNHTSTQSKTSASSNHTSTQSKTSASSNGSSSVRNSNRRPFPNKMVHPNSEAARVRFVTHSNILQRLRNNHPNKSVMDLVALANDAWKHDYNREARIDWLMNHPVNKPSERPRVVRKISYFVVEPTKEQFKKVLCASKTLVQLKKMAEEEGLNTQGRKKDICARIALFRNAKGRPVFIEPSTRIIERTTPCEKKTLPFLRSLARQLGIDDVSGTKMDLCKRMSN
jgi:hypothetical protein